MDFIDVVLVDIKTDQDQLTFAVKVAGTSSLPAFNGDSQTAGFAFNLNYRAEDFRLFADINSAANVTILLSRASVREFRSYAAFEGNDLMFTIPLSEMRSGSGFSPQPGELVTVSAIASYWDVGQASNESNGITPAYGSDQVAVPPDSSLAIPGQASGLRISSPSPTIAANGEETVLSWKVEVTDAIGQARSLGISVDGGDAATLDYPATVHLQANGNASFIVNAVFPFGHVHGSTRQIRVAAADDHDKVTLALQVLYLQPPQPAGHHDTLVIHPSAAANPDAYARVTMNTSSEGTDSPAGTMTLRCGPDTGNGWRIALKPTLVVGINGKEGSMGHVEADIKQLAPSLPLEFRARLALGVDGLNPDVDLTDGFTAKMAWSGDAGTRHIAADLPLPPELLYVTPRPGTNLFLLLAFCPTSPTPIDPAAGGVAAQVFMLQPGGTLRVPFQDFQLREDLNGPGLHLVADRASKEFPPGGIASWRLNVTGETAPKAMVRVVAPPEYQAKARVEASNDRGQVVEIRMRVPSNYTIGATIQFVVIAESETSAAQLRLGLTVDPTAQSAPEDLAARHGSPSPGFALALLAVGFAVGARRRTTNFKRPK